MAVQQNTDTAKNAPKGAASPTPQTEYINPNPQVDSAPGRLNFMNMIGRFSAGAGVTPEIELYLKNVKATVTNTLPGLEMTQLPEPLAAHAFLTTAASGEKYAYVIIFTDAIGARPAPNVPMSKYIAQAHQALVQMHPRVHMLNAVLITTRDLTRSRQMANAIVGALLPMVDPEIANSQASVLSAAGEFAIDLNVESARSFQNAHSPHDVEPRADIGFTLALKRSRARQPVYGYGSNDDVVMPFLSVTAMVEINGPQFDPATRQQKYLPIIRITSITSDLPLPGSILLGMVGAADYFIAKRLWTKAFSRFEKGVANLGNLFPNPDPKKGSELYFVSNQIELDTLIAQQFHQPLLCIDVQEGHDRIPSLSAFIDQQDGTRKILRSAQNFFGMEPQGTFQVGNQFATTFEGFYGDSHGRQIDTRTITYLDQVARHGVLDQATGASLMNYDMNPLRRAEVISALAPGFTSMFETFITALDSNFMGWVANAVKQVGLRITDPTGMSGYVQMPTTFTNYQNFTGITTPVSGGFGMPRSGLYV